MYHFNMNEIPNKQKRERLLVKVITGERIQMVFAQMEPGFISDHSHPHEQMGYVLSGEIELTIGDVTRRCGAGYSYHIPGNIHHSFKVVSKGPARIQDIFSPPKDENRL